jgi:N-acetyl-anhydromuramyl-L-alanine amidase AmpD
MKHISKFLIFLFAFSNNTFIISDIVQKPSPFYDQRECATPKPCSLTPKFIIIHFTANCSYQDSWKAFFNFLRPVSAHYVIGVDGNIAQMVPEAHRAWHAGESSWHGNTRMNNASIGIEIINPGFSAPDKDPCTINKKMWNKNSGIHISGSENLWYEFTSKQIESVIKLCRKIIKKHNIPACNILGHSDIAPGRKVDPGPLFPWQTLANHGIGLWWQDLQPCQSNSITDLQKKLQQFGYHIQVTGEQDAQTTKVVQAFQMHFQQDNISGIANEKTFQILDNLLAQLAFIHHQILL